MIKGKPCEICGGEFRYDDGRCVKCKRQRNKLQREIARAVEDEIFPDIVSGRDDIRLTEKDNQRFLIALWNEQRRSQRVREEGKEHLYKNTTRK